MLHLTHLSSETLALKTTRTINLSACCSLKAYHWKHKRHHKNLNFTASSTGRSQGVQEQQTDGKYTGRTSQKTPCSSAEHCYFPSSAPEHNPVHCKQHLTLLNSASVPMDKLHTISTAFRGRLLFPLIFGLWTQTAVEGFWQEGKDKRPPEYHWPHQHLCSGGMRAKEEIQHRGWWKTLNCLQVGSAVVQHNVFTSQVQMDVCHVPSQWEGKRLSLQTGTKKLPLGHKQVNKAGERVEVYLKSIISLLRKNQAFQELLNDELPVSLQKKKKKMGWVMKNPVWLGWAKIV